MSGKEGQGLRAGVYIDAFMTWASNLWIGLSFWYSKLPFLHLRDAHLLKA